MRAAFFFVVLFFASFAFGCDDFTRDDALRCMKDTIDLNKDGKISPSEIDAARAKLPWYLNWVSRLASTSRIMKDCDFDKDGFISMSDFESSAATCLPTQWSLCQLKRVC